MLLYLVSRKYENVSLALYISVIMVVTMFTLTTMFYWIKIKETILLIKANKDLIQTIRMILQVFPEAVFIRSLDDVSKQVITKYSNDAAKNVLNTKDVKVNMGNDFEVNFLNK